MVVFPALSSPTIITLCSVERKKIAPKIIISHHLVGGWHVSPGGMCPPTLHFKVSRSFSVWNLN